MSHALSDDQGLVCAFQLAPVRPRGEEVLKQEPDGQPLWLHFNVNDGRARRWLQDRARIPAEARSHLLSSESRIHCEVLPEGVMAVLGDLEHDFRGNAEGFHTLHLYLDRTQLITARRHPLKTVNLLRKQLQNGAVESASSIRLFEQLIEELASTVSAEVTKLGDRLDDLEEQILAGHLQHQSKDLGQMRRALARLRRHLNANRSALSPLPARLPAPYTAEERQGIRQSIERLDSVGQDLELVQERARLLQEEIAGQLTEATNRNLFLLSIVTTTLLPITLVTGVFGMNVGGLPWVGDPGGFWWVTLVMVAALVATLLLLRRRRVL